MGAHRNWLAVAILLLGAGIMLGLVLLPEVLTEGAGRRHLSATGGIARDRVSRGATATDPERDKEAAAPAQAEKDGEPVPYGDHDTPRDEAIRGRVLDKENEPVADAIVVAAYREWRTKPYQIVLRVRVRSEPDGYFILGPLERRNYYVLAIKEGVGVGYVASQMPGAWVDVVLAPGARVTGTVTAREGGAPVAGATVIVKDWSIYRETTTDEEGKYVLADLPASMNTWSGHEAIAVAPAFKRAERNNLLLRSDKEHRIDFSLEKGKSLQGKVVDAQTMQPVAAAVVGEGWEPYHRTTTTKEDGTYVLEHIDIAPNLLFTVRAGKYLPQQRQSDGSGEMDFELDSSLVLNGRVLTQKNEPVAGSRVYLHRIKYAPGFTRKRNNQAKTFTTSDAEGKFVFEDVLPGQVAVVAFHKENAPGEKGPIQIPVGGPAPDGIEVLLRYGLTVEGVVRDKQGEPIPGIQVQMQRSWGRIKGYKWVNNYRWSENPLWYSDDDGRFVLKGAVAGKHWISAWDNTFGWASTMIEGQEGQRIAGVVISFEGATISGTFLTAAGEPVPGANIQARGPKNTPRRTWRWTRTDSLGRFKMGGLKAGDYDITANSTFGNPKPLKDIPAGSENVELKLETTHVLRGEVTSVLTGRPIEEYTLSIQRQRNRGVRGNIQYGARSWSGTLRTPNGRFERPVTPGTYQVTVKAAGHAPQAKKNIIVEEHAPPREVLFRLDAGGGLLGTVTDKEGKPLRYAYVQARIYRAPGEKAEPTDWLLQGNDSTDSKGRYFMRGLAPGTYVLQLNMGSRGAATAQATVTGLGMVRQDLQLLPTGTVVLRVTDEEGKPLQGVMFYFRDGRNRWLGWARYTNAQGITTSQPLRMGPVTVQAQDSKNKHEVDNFNVTVQSGRAVTVDVQMRKKAGTTNR